MKVVAILACALLTGCASMTPTQKKVAAVVGGALVIGVVAAHGSGGPTSVREPAGLPCHRQPDGSCR